MKKFEFKLAAVHKVREMNEEKELSKLAQLREEVTETEKLIEDIESTRLGVMEDYLNGFQTGEAIQPAELDLYSRHFASLEKRRLEAEEALKEKRNACQMQVEELSKAAMDVKVTESLRDKQKAHFDRELSKKEQSSLDELTGAKFASRMATERNEYDVS